MKLTTAWIGSAATLVLTIGLAGAADQNRPKEETAPHQSQNLPGDPDAVKTVTEQANQDKAYMAALKKCDALKGDKQKCVDAAQRKFGRM